jgi:hypothetical protein
MNFRHIITLFLILCAQTAVSWETGFFLLNDVRAEIMRAKNKSKPYDIYEHGTFSTWLSFKPTETASLYFKGSFDFLNSSVLSESVTNTWKMSGNLDLMQFNFSPVPFFYTEFGRLYYSDILNLIADNSFDGALISFQTENHCVSVAAFYTGFLSKETAKIVLNEKEEKALYNQDFFAPPHFIMSFKYHYFPVFLPGTAFELNLLKQSNLEEDSQDQTTYFIGKASLELTGGNVCTIGAAFSTSNDENKTDFGFLAVTDYIIMLDKPYKSSIGFQLKIFYGNFEEVSSIPVITQKQLGYIYNPKLFRLAALNTQYMARFSETFTIECDFAVFMRLSSDYIPNYWFYSDFENPDSSNALLGEEFVFAALWMPVSDFSMNAGMGFFFPDNSPGSVYNQAASIKWDIRLGIILSF